MSKSKSTPVEVLPAEAEVPATLDLSVRLQKKLQAAPVQVQGTWASVRRWFEHARYLQEAALYCQVMIGFELIALKESMGEQRGGDRVSKSASRAPLSFVETATKEVGLSERSVWKFIAMAEAAATKLRKLPALRDFDPASTSLALLPDAQKEALSAAVHKMTDGLTQADFLVELGLAKAPQGSGATGGARERKPSEPMSVEEQAEVERTFGREDFRKAMLLLATRGERFTLLPDGEIREQIAWFEHLIGMRKTWVSQPQGKRDVAEVERASRDLLMGNLHAAI